MEEEEPRDLLDEPKKPSNPLKKIKTTGKTVINTTVNISKRVIGFFTNPAIPIPIKIGVIVVLAIVILVVVVLDAKADESSNAVNNTINSYLYTEGVDEEGKKLFLDKASLIKFPLKDINAIYDKFINDGKFANDIINEYKYIIGTKDVKDSDGVSSDNTANSDLLNLVKKAIAMAQKAEIKYGQDGRQTASTIEELDAITKTDCSGFVLSLFKVYLNIDVGSTSEDIKQKGESKHSENGWTAEIHEIGDGSQLQPGDILYRYNHVGIYVGDGKQVDHGGPGSANPSDSDSWRGPQNKEALNHGYTHYIRYTNPNVSAGGVADPNGNEAEGYARAYTDSKGRTYKEYGQSMAKWSNVTYWGSTIPYTGCGPTALAIIASGYGINETPETIANSMTPPTSSTELSRALKSTLKLKNTVYTSNQKEKMIENLKAERPVVISVFGTDGGAPANINFSAGRSHIIAALAINEDSSKVYIANPAASRNHGWVPIDDVIKCLDTYIITIDSDK